MKAVIKLLKDHNVEIQTGRIGTYIREWSTTNGELDYDWVDITNWTVEDANRWLGTEGKHHG